MLHPLEILTKKELTHNPGNSAVVFLNHASQKFLNFCFLINLPKLRMPPRFNLTGIPYPHLSLFVCFFFFWNNPYVFRETWELSKNQQILMFNFKNCQAYVFLKCFLKSWGWNGHKFTPHSLIHKYHIKVKLVKKQCANYMQHWLELLWNVF